jgi:PPP family 3-phenylpropionic acid transporter
MPTGLRLGLFYAAVFIGTGASLPYMPVWFRAHGLTGAEIGVVLSIPMLARAITAPGLAIWADGFALRRTPLMLLLLVAAAGYAAIGMTHGFGPWLVCWFIASSLMATVTPLTDVLTLRRARREGFNYGWPRGIGSAAFIVANVGVGALLTATSADLVLTWTVLAAALAGLCARILLPPEPAHEGGERPGRLARWRGLSGLLRDRAFMLAVMSVGLIQAGHAFYYAFSALAWRREGISELTVGLLWAFGVLVEIAFMWFAEPWRRRMGPERLLILGGAAAVIRWTAFAFSPPLWLLFPLQALHALSFAATFMAGLQLIERLSPPQSASAAQTVSSALSGGLLIGLATIASGALYDAVGARGYLAMAAMALLGMAGVRRLETSRALAR